MYKNCKSQTARARQRQLESGLLAYMKDHQYENITVSNLCDYMNIPRKSFYRYFTNKDGALYALIDHALIDFVDVFFHHGSRVDIKMAEQFFTYWLTQKDLLRALDHSNLSGLLVQRAIDLSVDDTRYVPAFFAETSKEIRDYTLLFVISGIISLLAKWERENFQKSPKEMAAISLRILNSSLFTAI